MAQVIKVKYQNVLRRVLISEPEQLSFRGLKERIAGIFGLPSDANLKITYTDCDNDVVALVDDTDVRDAIMLQRLNPLRLVVEEVLLSTFLTGSSPSAGSVQEQDSVSSADEDSDFTMVRAPSVEIRAKEADHPDTAAKATDVKVQESTRKVEEAMRLAYAESPGDADIEALVAQAPKIAEMMQDLAKSGIYASFEPTFKMPVATPALVEKAPVSSSAVTTPAESAEETLAGNVTSYHEETRTSFQAAKAKSAESLVSEPATAKAMSEEVALEQLAPMHATGEETTSGQAAADQAFENVLSELAGIKPASSVSEQLAPEPVPAELATSENADAATDEEAPARVTAEQASEQLSSENAKAAESEKVRHLNVECDMCGAHPILGPRYKSVVRTNYDLCGNCYELYGLEGEYTKIERALFRPSQAWKSSAGVPRSHGSLTFGGRPFTPAGTGCGRFCDPRGALDDMDARFVKDVTIFDGTEMAPATRFTKIWRLKNSGSAPWPLHTRLVSVGGDNMNAGDDFVAVQVPAETGLLPEGEVEVAVNLVAPEKLGRYVSHWRLMAPGGRKFGHRVWALIQVVPGVEQSPLTVEASASPAQATVISSETTGVETEAKNDVEALDTETAVEPEVESESDSGMEDAAEFEEDTAAPSEADLSESSPSSDGTSSMASSVTVSAEEASEEVPEVDAASDVESAAVIEGMDLPPAVLCPPAAPSSVDGTSDSDNTSESESPRTENTSVGGFSLVEHPIPGDASLGYLLQVPPVAAEQAPVAEAAPVQEVPVLPVEEAAPVEETPVMAQGPEGNFEELLSQLESMGFEDRALNADLLKQTGMDLQKTLDGLVAVGDWDPIVAELEEMGFGDASMNRRLLLKNKGSVRGVVKDLVQQYKDAKRGGPRA
eukprot:TRINITY_DN554_c0_g1_i1.p1 TRINITY_DN554_c0_g1~~TRINITY_DN554_c0_g1_i1.p1  ORF type:complete len:894 (+),score=195.02 TRINITY_DN554_c0_g1_i1:123-2804(+)